MVWVNGHDPLRPKQPTIFEFKLLDANGKAPGDMGFYMGMLGHAAFVKNDGSVFAHIHPNGSVAMAALMMTRHQGQAGATEMSEADMSEMDPASMHHGGQMQMQLPNEVGFPYGFPTSGRYRIFVQMKHGATIETGVFDAIVRQN
jgi:hypothetical protein